MKKTKQTRAYQLFNNIPKRDIVDIIKIVKPITNGVITSGYGERISPITHEKEFHPGIDISVVGDKSNVPVFAAKSGVIKWVDKTRLYDPNTGKGSFGVVCYVLGSDGWYSIYPHMDSVLLTTMIGIHVEAGTQLGIMGDTGLSVGKHLHYEERTKLDTSGKSREPIDIIKLYI